jgi:uncharacterized iron-regulated membrane protein
VTDAEGFTRLPVVVLVATYIVFTLLGLAFYFWLRRLPAERRMRVAKRVRQFSERSLTLVTELWVVLVVAMSIALLGVVVVFGVRR